MQIVKHLDVRESGNPAWNAWVGSHLSTCASPMEKAAKTTNWHDGILTALHLILNLISGFLIKNKIKQ